MQTEYIVHNFQPIYNEHSRILMLGTMPSPKSREVGFYYGHPRNRFWKVVSDVCQAPLPQDVLAGCEIKGADDSSIRNPVANDLGVILRHAKIQAVFTTGTKAGQLYKKYCLPKNGISAVTLPSTSPANCRMTYEELYEAYSVIKQYL